MVWRTINGRRVWVATDDQVTEHLRSKGLSEKRINEMKRNFQKKGGMNIVARQEEIAHTKNQLRMSKNQPLRQQFFKDKLAKLEKMKR